VAFTNANPVIGDDGARQDRFCKDQSAINSQVTHRKQPLRAELIGAHTCAADGVIAARRGAGLGGEMTARPQFIIVLEPEKHVTDPVRALRGALKRLLRSYGLRAVSVEEAKPANDGGAT